MSVSCFFFFFQAEDGIRDADVTGVQTCALPICLPVPQRAIVKGDALSVSIAAASIVAKVARDGIMRECDLRHPGYGLARNMGYASEDHREALRRMGPSSIHRKTFHGAGTQAWLFLSLRADPLR